MKKVKLKISPMVCRLILYSLDVLCSVENKPSVSPQTTNAPMTSDQATTTLTTAKRDEESICPTFTPVEGVRKNITCFLSEV